MCSCFKGIFFSFKHTRSKYGTILRLMATMSYQKLTIKNKNEQKYLFDKDWTRAKRTLMEVQGIFKSMKVFQVSDMLFWCVLYSSSCCALHNYQNSWVYDIQNNFFEKDSNFPGLNWAIKFLQKTIILFLQTKRNWNKFLI